MIERTIWIRQLQNLKQRSDDERWGGAGQWAYQVIKAQNTVEWPIGSLLTRTEVEDIIARGTMVEIEDPSYR